MPAPDASAAAAEVFVTTRWTRVVAARGGSAEAQQALSDLCAAYYAPVVTFLRAEGRDEDAARELAHAFFAGVLERQSLGGAEPGRGRFRSYLLGALKHFLSRQRDRAQTAKRGGGVTPESLDAADTGTGPPAPAVAPANDAVFDRQWALTLMERALTALEREFAEAGRPEHFAAFKPWLVADAPTKSQEETARALGMNEGAVKVAVHRLRRRLRELIKSEIAQTVDGAARVDEEFRYLIDVLARG
jgi:RNA polymerase sigma-70 factor (ECF subfamily)